MPRLRVNAIEEVKKAVRDGMREPLLGRQTMLGARTPAGRAVVEQASSQFVSRQCGFEPSGFEPSVQILYR